MTDPTDDTPDRREPRLDGPALTRREREVVGLVADGLSNSEIAARLHLSLRTAQAHVAAAMKKLGARSRTQLAVFALRRGIVPLHAPEDDGCSHTAA